jgi:uncharacterized membrane protein YqgA involved in biofilm formation
MLDAAGVALGALAGVTVGNRLNSNRRTQVRYFIAAAAFVLGFAMTWDHARGSVLRVAGQYGLGMLALVAGNAAGLAMRFQWIADRFQNQARNALGLGELGNETLGAAAAFILSPLLVVGVIAEGGFGDPRPLFLKAGVDALAAFILAEKSRWSPVIAIVPLVAIQGLLTLGAAELPQMLSLGHNQADAIGMVSGLIILSMAVAVTELRRVNAMNYLPALAFAVVVARWW